MRSRVPSMACTPPSSTKPQAALPHLCATVSSVLRGCFPGTSKITLHHHSSIQCYSNSKFLLLFRPLWVLCHFVFDNLLFSSYHLHQKPHVLNMPPPPLAVLSSSSHAPVITFSRGPIRSNLTPCPTLTSHFEPARLPPCAEPYTSAQVPSTSIKAMFSCFPSPKKP